MGWGLRSPPFFDFQETSVGTGKAGQLLGLVGTTPLIGGQKASDDSVSDSRGCTTQFIGFGLNATFTDPAPPDFNGVDYIVKSAGNGSDYSPAYVGDQISWGSGGGGGSFPNLTSLAGFGDSITEGAYLASPSNRWLNMMATALGAGADILNAGISGTVLQNTNLSTGSPAVNNGRDRVATALLGYNKKDGLAIAYGFNDGRYNEPTVVPSTFNFAAYKADYQEVMNAVIQGGYDVNKIVILNPYWISDYALASVGSGGFTGRNRAQFEQYVQACEEIAVEYGTWFGDTYGALEVVVGDNSLVEADLLHPNAAGHVIIKDTALAATKINPKAAPVLTASSPSAGVINWSITAVTGATSYTVGYAANGTYTFADTTSGNLTGSLTGLPYAYHAVRARANFADGSSSAWVWSVKLLTGSTEFSTSNFTGTVGTAITAYTPDTGSAWVAQTPYAPATPSALDGTGGLYSTTTAGIYRNSSVPPGLDYYVEAVLKRLTVVAGDKCGVTIRANAAADTFYFAHFDHTAGGWRLYRNNSGSNTAVGSLVADTFAAGSSKTLKLQAVGTTIKVFVNGAEIISYTDSAPIAGPGFAGVRMALATTPTTGIHIDSFRVGAL